MKPKSSPYMVVARLESATSIRNNHILLQCLLGASICILHATCLQLLVVPCLIPALKVCFLKHFLLAFYKSSLCFLFNIGGSSVFCKALGFKNLLVTIKLSVKSGDEGGDNS
jgi:hypothetical protein